MSDQTEGEIPTLFGPNDITSNTRIVLANAVYFKGTWDNGFDPTLTAPAPFTLSDGTMVQVPTMSGYVNTSQSPFGPDAFIYELPYKGDALAMDFVVPRYPESLSTLESSLDADMLSASLASLTGPQQVQLLLPKFSFTTNVTLNDILTNLGMPDAFDFSAMDGQMDLTIGQVVHQAQIEVDEQGTVAAAVTVVESAVMLPPVLHIDLPFLFLIRDVQRGIILIIGHVEDPRQGS